MFLFVGYRSFFPGSSIWNSFIYAIQIYTSIETFESQYVPFFIE